jgi:hypothetical protein
MLDASDASAEWGSTGRWVADTGTVAAVEHMTNGLPETYPWLMDEWFLRLTPSGGAGSMSCKGGDDAVPEWHDAVPVPRWGYKVRIGAYLEAASGVVATLTVTAFDEDMVSLGTLGGANGLLKVTGNGTGWNWHAGDYVTLPVVGGRPTRYLMPKVTMTGTSPLGVDAITLDIAKSENSDYV